MFPSSSCYRVLALCAVCLCGNSIEAKPFSLLVTGSKSQNVIREDFQTSSLGYSYGLSLLAPEALKTLALENGKSDNKASLTVALNLGLELGVLWGREKFIYDSVPIEARVVKVPLTFWATIMPVLWLGVGLYYIENQSPVPSGLAKVHNRAFGTVRINLYPSRLVGLAIEGRYAQAISNVAAEPERAFLDSTEVLVSLRLGSL